MSISYAADAAQSFYPDPQENTMQGLFRQYERVLVDSLITSFGLDFLVKDRHGGDVDTIHNVRQIDTDDRMVYKNSANAQHYTAEEKFLPGKENAATNRELSEKFYKDDAYKNMKHHAREQYRNSGIPVMDAYTGDELHFLGRTTAENAGVNAELDHTVSKKSIQNDRGRILANCSSVDLANLQENLNFTNAKLNRSMQDMEIPEYIEKHPDLSDNEKRQMMNRYKKAKKAIGTRIATAYYTSPAFAGDLTLAAGNVGLRMGARQVIGFIFTEMWFSVKEEFQNQSGEFDLGEFFSSLGRGIQRGYARAKEKYAELISKFFSGALSGAMPSLTTTICNIFFTTAKNVVKIIRQSYASLVEAGKVLFINPDNYTFGERMRAVVKILATGASVVAGALVSEALEATPIGQIPVLGDVVQTFCGAFVTGILSCTFLYFLDRSELMNRLFKCLDNLHTIETEISYYRQQADYFEQYAAELMNIDLPQFQAEVELYSCIANDIEAVKSEHELNYVLRKAYEKISVSIPWKGYDSFKKFMDDKNSQLVFQ